MGTGVIDHCIKAQHQSCGNERKWTGTIGNMVT